MPEPYLLVPEPCRDLSEYLALGRGAGLDAAARLTADAIRDLVEQSGLRGRDQRSVNVGSGWKHVVAQGPDAGTRYLVADGTDSEPGAFADRTLVRLNPFAVLEGLVIAATAIGARDAYLVIRRSFDHEYDLLHDAIAQAEVAGWLDRVSVKCVRASEGYVLSDPRALLENIEGRDATPLRGDPATDGLFAVADRPIGDAALDAVPEPSERNPTIVESFETLANLGPLLANGVQWFRNMGTAMSPGHLLVTVTGDVQKHRVAEVELGRRLFDVLEEVGCGYLPSSPPKAVLSGVSSPVLTRSRLSAPLSWEGLGAVGARVGRAAFMVFGEATDMVRVAYGVSAFLYVESCGWCPACKFGGGEITARLAQLHAGSGGTAEVDLLGSRLAQIDTGARCGLAARHHDVVASILRAFPGDLVDRTDAAEPAAAPFARLVDLVGGVARWDDTQLHRDANGVLNDQLVQLTRW